MTMNRPTVRLALFALAGLLLATPGPASAQALNIKLGLWETTTTIQMSGAPPIDTSKMTPEQRARIMGALEASRKRGATPHTRRSCMTKDKLAKDLLQDKNDRSCKETVIASSSTAFAVRMACSSEGGGTSSGEWHFEATTPEQVTAIGQFTIEKAGNKMTSTSTLTGKWLGASCGDVK